MTIPQEDELITILKYLFRPLHPDDILYVLKKVTEQLDEEEGSLEAVIDEQL